MSPNEKINYRIIPGKVEMWSDADDISWLVFAPESEISRDDMEEIIAVATRTHKSGELFRVLADISGVESISHEARSYASGENFESIYSCLAIVAGTPATRLVGNFFIRFHKPPRPVKIFGTTEEAKVWLKNFK